MMGAPRAKKDIVTNLLFDYKAKLFGSSRVHRRFRLKSLHHVHLEVDGVAHTLSLTDISLSGMGILNKDPNFFKNQGKAQARLIINNNKFKVHFKIVYRSNDAIGVAFINPEEKLANEIKRYFEIEMEALKLNAVETKSENNKEKILLISGSNNCEVFIQTKDEVASHFHIVLFGNYMEFGEHEFEIMGRKIAPPTSRMINKISIFQRLDNSDKYTLECGIRFIDGIEQIALPLKQFMRNRLLSLYQKT